MERQVDSGVSQPRTPPSSSTPLSKLWPKTFAPLLLLPFLSSPRHKTLSAPPSSPASVREPEGEDTCDQKPVTWQPSQKAFMIVTRQGAGIYFPPVRSPFHPLGPPGSAREPKRKSTVLAFSAASRFPSREKHNSTQKKKSRQTSCPFVRFLPDKGAVYCTPPRDSCIHTRSLFDGEWKANVRLSKRPYFHKHTKQNALCLSRSLTSRLLLHSMWARFAPGFKVGHIPTKDVRSYASTVICNLDVLLFRKVFCLCHFLSHITCSRQLHSLKK